MKYKTLRLRASRQPIPRKEEMARRRSIYLGDPLVKVIEERNPESLSRFINAMVDRYGVLVRELEPHFTPEEWELLSNALEGFNSKLRYMGVDVEEFLDDEELINPELVAKINALTDGQKIAVLDKLERDYPTTR